MWELENLYSLFRIGALINNQIDEKISPTQQKHDAEPQQEVDNIKTDVKTEIKPSEFQVGVGLEDSEECAESIGSGYDEDEEYDGDSSSDSFLNLSDLNSSVARWQLDLLDYESNEDLSIKVSMRRFVQDRDSYFRNSSEFYENPYKEFDEKAAIAALDPKWNWDEDEDYYAEHEYHDGVIATGDLIEVKDE